MAVRPVDEKIVVMKLDNSELLRKATETTTIFGKLKSALGSISDTNLGKTTNDMSELSQQSTGASSIIERMAGGVSALTSRFSTLGVIGTTALVNITNRAVDMGISLAKGLTVDQVGAGFSEYETKINAIGTMLSNTEWAGSTLDDVKKTLGELNDYADQTVYNFGQMTENIGRFTAAGVTLEDSAIAIKGLGNLAAVSGSDVNQLNTAMYQMSQALASGKLNLEDWNSLVNAGMAGKKTQDALAETARAMGKTVNLTDGFRNSIQDGWLTSEVLLETLKKFGNDDSMTEAATAVRTFTGAMDALKEGIGSGWATTWELIFGDFEEATVFWTKLNTQVGGWFSKTTDARNKLVEGIAKGGGFMNIFDGVQNAVKPVLQVFDAFGDGFSKAFPPKSVNQIVAMTESFKQFTAGLTLSNETMNKLRTIFQGGFSVLSAVMEIAKRLGSAFLNIVPPDLGGSVLDILEKFALMAISFSDSVKEGNILTEIIDGLGNVLGAIGKTVGIVGGAMMSFGGSLTENVGKAIEWLAEKLAPLGQMFKDAFGEIGGDDLLGAGGLAGIIAIVTMFGGKISGIFDGFGDLTDGFKDTLEAAGDAIQNFAMGIKIANLVLIAGAVTLLAISLKTLEGIDAEDLTKGIVALAASLGVMMAGLAVISKFNLVGGMGASVTILALAVAVTIMASALESLAEVNMEDMKKGLMGIAGLVATLSASIILMSKFGGKMAVGSLQLVALATAIYILSEAVQELSTIDSADITKSVITLGVLFAELALFLKVVNAVKFGPGAAIGVIAIAGALLMMTGALENIATLDTNELIKGLVAIGVILAQIGVFSLAVNGAQLALSAVGIGLIAGAINLLVGPIRSFGEMSLGELALGLGAMAIALAAVAGAGILATGAVGGAVAITLMAVALNLLVAPIKDLSQMTWEELIKGFIGLGGGLALMAGAAILLTPAVPAMLAFGVAVGLIGVAVLAAGAGIALFGLGLATLATATVTSIAAIVSSLALLLKGLADLIPAVVTFIVELASALIDGIIKLVPKLANAIGAVINGLLAAITKHLPEFLDLGIELIIQLINGIGEYTPALLEAGVSAIVDLIQGLADTVENQGPELISAILDLMGEIILLVVEAGAQTINALFGWIPGVEKATAAVGETATEYIRANFGAKQVGEEKGREFAKAVEATKAESKVAGEKLAKSAEDGADTANLKDSGEKAGKQFADGINSQAKSVEKAASNMASRADLSIRKTLDINSPSKVTDKSGQETGKGFADGIKKKEKSAAKAAKDMATKAKEAFDEKMESADFKLKMGEIDTAGYIKELQKIQTEYKKTPELYRKVSLEIKKAQDDLVKELEDARKKEFDTSKSYIDDRKFYNKMSLEEELSAWTRIQVKFEKGTEQRKQADREVYKLKKDLIKKEEDDLKKQFDNSKSWIDQRKSYNELSLVDEYEAWTRIQAKYKEGTEQRKQADLEVYRLKNEINNKMISLNEEYTTKISDLNKKLIDGEKAINDEYTNTFNSRVEQLTGFAGIFDEITKKSEISGSKLIENLRGQVETFAQWSNNISSLANRGIDEGLLEELRQMGPKAAAEIAALNTLTDVQLTEYSTLWKTKNQQAREEAEKQLVDTRLKANEEIEKLRSETNVQLSQYVIEWQNKMAELKNGTTDQFVQLATSMNTLGSQAIQGLMDGMSAMEGPLIAQAQALASVISSTIQGVLDINSPSRVLRRDGNFAGEGVILGLRDKVKGVRNAAMDVATTVKDTIEEFMAGASLDDFDETIHIKAVVDYDGFNPNDLNGVNMPIVPSNVYASRSVLDIDSTNRQNDNRNNDNPKPVTTQVDKKVEINQEMNFYTREMSPADVARKNLQTSRDLAMQWEVI